MGLALSFSAGIVEELVYRGFLIAYLTPMAPTWMVIAVSSLLFGAAHLYQGIVGVISTTLSGVVFAVMYMSTGSLVLPMLLHAMIDVSSMLTAFIVLRPKKGDNGI